MNADQDWAKTLQQIDERIRLQRAHARYEYLRRLNPRQFSELWQANLDGKGTFDELVDQRIAQAHD
jgi:hypothetical protein